VKKKYFVSFTFENEKGIGYGNCDVITKHRLNSYDKVTELEQDIKNKHNARSVVINSWKRLWL
jgi:hypothetical protein